MSLNNSHSSKQGDLRLQTTTLRWLQTLRKAKTGRTSPKSPSTSQSRSRGLLASTQAKSPAEDPSSKRSSTQWTRQCRWISIIYSSFRREALTKKILTCSLFRGKTRNRCLKSNPERSNPLTQLRRFIKIIFSCPE